MYDARGKVTRVDALGSVGRGASQYTQWYSGLGNLVATDWDNLGSFEWQREEYRVDALGNMRYKRVHTPGPEWVLGNSPLHAFHLNSIHGHVASVHRVSAAATPPVEDDFRIYDGSGNLVQSRRQVLPVGHAGAPYVSETSETRSYYDASERLRVYQTSELRFTEGSYFGSSAGIWEEYRYDPLGRRIGVRTLRGSDICNVDSTTCTTARTRFVWAGDQILWEMREVEDGTSPGEAGGTVSYFHAGGIDRPLTLWKAGVGTVVAHQNWRGQFARGTFASGPRAGESSDCVEYPPQGGCVPVRWPGWTTTAWHETLGKQDVTGYEHYWFGSLAVGMRDASGQMYMRNRYYDPATGQFTQPDPIGLAGGLNTYGFAAGDPVGFWDPFGLCPGSESASQALSYYADVANSSRGARRGLAIAGGLFSALWTSDNCVDTVLALGPEVVLAVGSRTIAGYRALQSSNAASSAADGIRLWKQMASAELLGEAQAGIGIVMAGAGARNGRQIDDIARLVDQYGGNAADWAKMSTRERRASDGTKISIHWYENVRTGHRVEFKQNL